MCRACQVLFYKGPGSLLVDLSPEPPTNCAREFNCVCAWTAKPFAGQWFPSLTCRACLTRYFVPSSNGEEALNTVLGEKLSIKGRQ